MSALHDMDSDIGSTRGGVDEASALVADVADGGCLHESGRRWGDIRAELVARKRGDYNWRGGRVPIYVYHDSDELLSVSKQAYNLYFSENALGGRAFPSLVGLESDVVRMALGLFRAPKGSAGSFTSGGTESLFLALKAARDYFKHQRPRGVVPNIVVPRTAHPAFDKASQYLGVQVIRTGVDQNFRADVDELMAAVDDKTMLIAASAPCYPYGVFDPIESLSEMAAKRGLWLHVDACLGGFIAPFAREQGHEIPEFDLSLPGVSSLSADLHKYGFSARGASVLLYRSEDLKAWQVFRFDRWPRGSYSTETFQGSRPGGVIASAWAVSQYLGREGYRRLARKTMEAKQQLVRGIEQIEPLEVLRPSDLTILLYRSKDRNVDIDAVGDCMSMKGWFVGKSREPRAVHMALNPVHAPIVNDYLTDLRDAVLEVRASRRVGTYDDATY